MRWIECRLFTVAPCYQKNKLNVLNLFIEIIVDKQYKPYEMKVNISIGKSATTDCYHFNISQGRAVSLLFHYEKDY
ncbi:hypothetical protein BML2537_21960 [Providencia stuartii]|nr:hypothetical protein AL507_04325 [Providencia stuartii]BBV08702.1 hypothetical protein BML2537_21960 [Providencia stuartii]GHB86687.1 hypothetical protein GCM10007290_10070 [Providencia thailandensis]